MNASFLSRRQWIGASLAGSAATSASWGAGAVAQASAAPTGPGSKPALRFALNTGTIRGQQLGLVEAIELAAATGYDAIEPWIDEIRRYQESGGDLGEVARRCRDLGLEVASAIGFAQWIVDEPGARARGLEQARRDMDVLRQIGGTRIAAPPAGATGDASPIALSAVAERYARLLEAGDAIGVIPQVEVWGFAPNLSRLGEAVYAAVESGHPRACVLPDVYHLYKGGSDFNGLRLLSAAALPCFHLNDYPAQPVREQIEDRHRVFPGDGVAPLTEILRMVATSNPACVLSLELFNRDYWQQEPRQVAEAGLAKCRAAVERAFADELP